MTNDERSRAEMEARVAYDEIDRLKAELAKVREQHALEMAGVMTASIQNTEQTVRDRIGKDNPFYTQAYADVCAAVDREMKLKAELAKAKAENNRVLALLGTCSAVLSTIGYDTLSVLNIHKIIQDACARAKEEPGSKNITGGP